MITVVITTYKRDSCIVKRAIESVVAQTYTDWELIIVDDSPSSYCGRENVKKLIDEYKNRYRISYIEQEKNRGACVARNTGLAAAQGKYIAYLDDDDEWLPNKLEKQLQVFDTSSEKVAIVGCGYFGLFERNGERRVMNKTLHRGDVFEKLFVYNFLGGTSNPLFRTDYLREIDGFDIEQPSEQDLDVYLRLANKYCVDFVEDPLVIYHISEADCISANPQKRIAGILRNNSKHNDFLDKKPFAKYSRLMMLAREYSKNSQMYQSMKCWLNMLRLCPNRILLNLKNLMILIRDRLWQVRR